MGVDCKPRTLAGLTSRSVSPPLVGDVGTPPGFAGCAPQASRQIIGAATATGGGTGSTGCGAVSVGGTTAEEVSGPGVDEGELSGVAEFATLEGSEQEAPTAVARSRHTRQRQQSSSVHHAVERAIEPGRPACVHDGHHTEADVAALRAARSGRGSAPHFWPGLHVRPTASSMRCATFNSRASSPHGARSCRPIGSPV